MEGNSWSPALLALCPEFLAFILIGRFLGSLLGLLRFLLLLLLLFWLSLLLLLLLSDVLGFPLLLYHEFLHDHLKELCRDLIGVWPLGHHVDVVDFGILILILVLLFIGFILVE